MLDFGGAGGICYAPGTGGNVGGAAEYGADSYRGCNYANEEFEDELILGIGMGGGIMTGFASEWLCCGETQAGPVTFCF